MVRQTKKKRTTPKAPPSANDGSPKSMVIRIGAGEVGPSVSQLVKDVRRVMEPGTASRLKERRANKLRDYTTMCGPLGVTHLLLFSRSESGNTNLRLGRTPRGPTLHFRVENYSLCKDILKAQKRPRTGGPTEYMTAPLLVMNNFITPDSSAANPSVPRHLERLATEMFQSLFPPISPQNTPLTSIRRVLLLNREPTEDGSYTVNLRHYAITTKKTGLSKAIRRLNAAEKLTKSREKKKKALPNLGKLDDVADFMLDPSGAGYTSASDTEIETEAEVEVLSSITKKVLNRRELQKKREEAEEDKPLRRAQDNIEKRAVKLTELGPRMKLRLFKVEEDICAGKVLWHEYLEKSQEEVENMDRMWDQRRKEKAERRRVQKENIEKKRKQKGSKADGAEGEGGADEDDDEDEDMADYDLDDDEWESDGEGGVQLGAGEMDAEDDEEEADQG